MASIRRYEPLEFAPLDRVLTRFFNDPFFAHAHGQALQSTEEGALALDVSEDAESVIVRASLPGFRKEDVHVELHDGVLAIKAEHTQETEENGEKFYRRERTYGSVSRRIALPSSVHEDQAQAELHDGVLTLRLPKTKAETPKKITVS